MLNKDTFLKQQQTTCLWLDIFFTMTIQVSPCQHSSTGNCVFAQNKAFKWKIIVFYFVSWWFQKSKFVLCSEVVSWQKYICYDFACPYKPHIATTWCFCFPPFKTLIPNFGNERILGIYEEQRTDIYTLSEILH